MGLTKRNGEAVLNIIGSLQGSAWRLVEDFNLDECEKESAFESIIKLLDGHFEYDTRVQLPSDFDGYFGLQRKPGQTLLAYVSDHAELHKKLEKHGVSLPTAVQGWHLLRKSGLTKEQRQLVNLRAPQLELTKVVEAMYLILGQDYKLGAAPAGHDRRWHRGKGGRAYFGDELDDDGDADDWDWDSQSYYDAYWEWDDNASFDEQGFDDDAAYYQTGDWEAESTLPDDGTTSTFDVASWDDAYAAYLDARKRFNDLKLSRGYLPIVALQDSNLQPGTSSPSRSSGGGSPKGKKGKGKSKGGKPNMYKYDKAPMKPAQPQQRAQAALQCLRCGQKGHFAANCPVNNQKSSPNKRPAPATESMAKHAEGALVTFMDKHGHERTDVAMLDPGASAFLCGYGPMGRYLKHLQQLGYPVETILFYRCDRKFHFGGDAESVAKWVARMPMFVNGLYGFAQVFMVPGETPMLCGRPIIQQLGIALDFSSEKIRYGDGQWMPALMGLHGEYLLPLSMDFEIFHAALEPHFDLQLASPGEVDLNPRTFLEFNGEEMIFQAHDHGDEWILPGTVKCQRHLFQTMDARLTEELNDMHGYITSELHAGDRGRVIWEVYGGRSRMAQIAESLGATVRVFSLDTGWDFDQPAHQRAFLALQEKEVPDEIYLSPTCGPWSLMQGLAARTPEQQQQLRELREWHHQVHLCFCKKVYLKQIKQGGHAHLEQPAYARSWRTSALSNLPGLYCRFDQCQYGCTCQDTDLVWRLVQKPTGLQTTKMAVHKEFQRRCAGDHQHCRLEGSGPDVGRRTRYLEHYQPTLASTLAACLMMDELPTISDFVGAADDEKKHVGRIIQLLTNSRQEAVRCVQRLHRNLGHPSMEALVETLESRGASDVVLEVARNFSCASCERYKKPDSVPPAVLNDVKEFNHVLQADVMWVKVKDRKFPILSLLDQATRYQAAGVLHGERSEHFLSVLERHWVRHFGCPKTLLTDEGRGWASDEFQEWVSAHMVEHLVAPGEAHTRLALVERRHAVLRKAVEIYMADLGLSDRDGLRQALAYTIPQLNSSTTVAGYSPNQWLLGYQPQLAGELLSDSLGPAHLEGNQPFEETLKRRAAARNAITAAEVDRKLRRALLRKYQRQQGPLTLGQSCFYWRDSRASDLKKIRWHGPARVVMVEHDEQGRPRLYWVAHRTQLIRAAPHHVRPDFTDLQVAIDGLQAARHDIAGLKSRGVTRFLDLGRLNRRNIDDVDDDEEGMQDDAPDDGEDGDGGDPQEPPSTRRRTGDHPGVDLDLPPGDQPDLDFLPVPEPIADPPDLDLDLQSAGERSVSYSPSIAPDEAGGPPIGPELQDAGDSPIHVDSDEPGLEPPHPETPAVHTRAPSMAAEPAAPEPLPVQPPGPSSMPPAPTSTNLNLYEPAGPEEEFRHRRILMDRAETSIFGPMRQHRQRQSQPYDKDKDDQKDRDRDVREHYMQSFDILDVDPSQIPDGWKIDDDGYFSLTNDPMDYWEVKAGCVIRHHVRPRRCLFKIKEISDVPIPADLLDANRTTVAKAADGKLRVINDLGAEQRFLDFEWTGCTIFQISGKARREMGMFASLPSKRLGKDTKIKMAKQHKKVANSSINERLLSPDDRAKFQEAKSKELQSFFENQVWEFDTVENAQPERTLTARVLTKWSKNPDGSPRAKARLIVRGYLDVDALDKGLQTSSPTTSRTSRNFLMSLTALLGWSAWTADVATAFLQGLPQERKLWVKLPPECLRLLGAPDTCRMLLLKPVYGQLDAPRRWYQEATRRLKDLGLRPHYLDPCCFLAYEADFNDGASTTGTLGDSRLCGMVCLHVDDLLGSGCPTSPTWQRIIKELQSVFNFREWKDGDVLQYCGCSIEKLPDGDGLKLFQQTYVEKIHPMTIPRSHGPDVELTSKEITALRGLCGALQWPSVQSSPHLQASVSLAAGQVNNAKVSTVQDLNRTLKFAKQNGDVGLVYKSLGPVEQLRLVTLFDASFSTRPDGSSQGGYMILLVPEHTLVNQEDNFHMLEWRSMKLPRVARSSLAAETQAAAQATDATDAVCKFWDHLLCPNLQLAELLRRPTTLKPVMITDAKALYDSFHRETVTANVTDRRTALEIRVIKELLQDLGGELRWVSSERQWADGLTKTSSRQLLANRLRHGKIGFYWDPQYVAAKRKPAQERQANMDQHAAPPPQRLRVINEDVMDEELGDETETQDAESPANAAVASGVYMVYTDEVIEYINTVLPQSEGINVYEGAIFEKMRYYLGFTSAAGILSALPNVEPGILFFMVLLVMFLVVILAAYVKLKLKKAFDDGYLAAMTDARGAIAQSRALPILFARMDYEQQHIAQEYRNFARNRDFLENADRQRDAGVDIMRRALIESFDHADVCPLSDLIWVTNDNIWHAQPQCRNLPSGRLNEANGVRRFQPCPTCSTGEITPYALDGRGVSLLRELETWITEQGATAWPVAMHG